MFARAAQKCTYLNRCGIKTCARYYRQTYYEVLEVPRNSSQKRIQQAFLEKSKQLHPDKKLHDGEQHDKFVQLNEAYTCLSREESRLQYDLTLPEENNVPPPLYSNTAPKRGLFRVHKKVYYQMIGSAAIVGVLAGILYLITLDWRKDREQELFLLFKSPEALDDTDEGKET